MNAEERVWQTAQIKSNRHKEKANYLTARKRYKARVRSKKKKYQAASNLEQWDSAITLGNPIPIPLDTIKHINFEAGPSPLDMLVLQGPSRPGNPLTLPLQWK